MVNMRVFVTIFALVFPLGNSFIFDKKIVPVSGLGKLVEAQTEQRVSLGLDIGKPKDISRLAINGIVFDLTKRVQNFQNDFVKMPGLHGPKPSLSGGLHALTTVEDGTFTSMTGSNFVKPLNGCWEIIWREGSPCGAVICGFEIDRDYKRNDATLPKGTIYVSFHTWTSEGLKKAQETKESKMKRSNDALQKKNEEIAKMVGTNNVILKAKHYFNALSFADTYMHQASRRMSDVPNSDEVIHFEGDMYVSTKGKVWTQDLPVGKPVVLGTATMKSVSKEA